MRPDSPTNTETMDTDSGSEIVASECIHVDPEAAREFNTPEPEHQPMCWMCVYSSSPTAKFVANYMTENVGTVSPPIMAAEINRLIMDNHPDAEGASPRTCLEHLTSHTLTPVIQFSIMLRSLIKLRDEMRKSLHAYNEDGRAQLDPKSIEAYLKVQNQITLIYKTNEPNKLLFA